MKRLKACLIVLLMIVLLCGCSSPSASQPDSGSGDIITPSPTNGTESQFGSDLSEDWKADFEASLFEQFRVKPDRYEDLGDGIFQVYVTIEGNSVPFVTVDSKTGEYHG